jgi:nitrogen fixation/metabolism regulation signal transduction histidine kinase
METHETTERMKKRGSRILYEITALLVVVFLIFGLLAFFLFLRSENRLIDKSIDRLKETEANNLNSGYDYVIAQRTNEILEMSKSTSPQEYINSINTGIPGHIQNSVSEILKGMVDAGMLGVETNMFIFTRMPVTSKPILFASSDQELVLNWQVPDWLAEAIEKDEHYLWMDKGIPELGLQGDYLVTINQVSMPELGVMGGFVGIKPMGEAVASIKDFYSQEKRSISTWMLLLMIISIIVIMVITFTVLSYLIRKRLTEPINELSAAAEQVMEGNLEVRVPVRKGEELEKLKTVFNEMVHSIREVINRSMGLG